MTGRTVKNNPIAGPIAHPLAVGASQPVTFLAEMTLTAQLVAMIKINLRAFFIFQRVQIDRMVAVNAAERTHFLTMINHNIAVGKLEGTLATDLFFGVTTAALVPFDILLPGENPKRSALIFFPGKHRRLHNRPNPNDAATVKRCVDIFYRIEKGRFVRRPGRSAEQDRKDA